MDRAQHDAFVQELLDIENTFSELDLANLELTDEEARAIADVVPEQTIAEVEEIVTAYSPRSGVDVRIMLVMKLLGLMATKATAQLADAFRVGWRSP